MVKSCFPNIVIQFVLAFICQSMGADTVTLTDGTKIEGTILAVTDTTIKINRSGTVFDLPKSKVTTYTLQRSVPAVEPPQAEEARRKTIEDRIRKGDMPLEEADRLARELLANPNLSSEESSRLKDLRAGILVKRAEMAELRKDLMAALKYLEEAAQLAPEKPGVTMSLVRMIQKRDKNDPRIAQLLKPYVAKNPEDLEAIEVFVSQTWRTDPWTALKVIYPGNKPHPKTTKAMNDLLANVLLACFSAKPYPPNAPFDRVSCIERFLALRPDADRTDLYLAREEKEPQNPQHPYDRADYYELKGELEKAEKTFQDIHGRVPQFKDVAKRLEAVRQRICERDIAAEEKAVADSETLFRQAAALSAADFPLTPDSAKFLQSAKDVAAVFQQRPVAKLDVPRPQYLQALRAYRETLKARSPAASQLFAESGAQKAQVEAERRKALAKESDERNRQRAEEIVRRVEAELGKMGALGASMTTTGEMRIPGGDGTYYVVRNIRATGGRIVSCSIVSPIQYEYRAK